IDSPGKSTFGRECRWRGTSDWITRRRTPADMLAPSGGRWRSLVWRWDARRTRPRQGVGRQRQEGDALRARPGAQEGPELIVTRGVPHFDLLFPSARLNFQTDALRGLEGMTRQRLKGQRGAGLPECGRDGLD